MPSKVLSNDKDTKNILRAISAICWSVTRRHRPLTVFEDGYNVICPNHSYISTEKPIQTYYVGHQAQGILKKHLDSHQSHHAYTRCEIRLARTKDNDGHLSIVDSLLLFGIIIRVYVIAILSFFY